jgi:hypothetical protein
VNDNDEMSDEMSDADRAQLHTAIEKSIAEIDAGQTIHTTWCRTDHASSGESSSATKSLSHSVFPSAIEHSTT